MKQISQYHQLLSPEKNGSIRRGFGRAITELVKNNKQIVVTCADLTSSLQLTEVAEKYPDQFVQVGVAEQNLMGISAGLALGKKIPFAASYSVFNPGRNWDQLRVSVCYSNLNVKIVGGHAGLSTGPDGATHQALEDIAITRVLPNLAVVVPADEEQAYQATLAAAEYPGPVYLRLTRERTMNLLSHPVFTIGQAHLLADGDDLTLISCGDTLSETIKASQMLEMEGIRSTIVNLHTIKPLDSQKIVDQIKRTNAVVTVENHQKHGGVGSAIAEVIAENIGKQLFKPVAHTFVAVDDTFSESGNAQELFIKYKIDKMSIIEAAKQTLNKKQKLNS
ncbi:MAG: transketolase family protein [Patescibacteria group bacterium]